MTTCSGRCWRRRRGREPAQDPRARAPGESYARSAMTASTTKEPDIITHNREQLAYLLTEAAEIEHGLMCCYLYAANTLKRGASEGLAEHEAAAVERWRDAIVQVAIDEMLHLALVNNLLSAIGSAPHFQR